MDLEKDHQLFLPNKKQVKEQHCCCKIRRIERNEVRWPDHFRSFQIYRTVQRLFRSTEKRFQIDVSKVMTNKIAAF